MLQVVSLFFFHLSIVCLKKKVRSFSWDRWLNRDGAEIWQICQRQEMVIWRWRWLNFFSCQVAEHGTLEEKYWQRAFVCSISGVSQLGILACGWRYFGSWWFFLMAYEHWSLVWIIVKHCNFNLPLFGYWRNCVVSSLLTSASNAGTIVSYHL